MKNWIMDMPSVSLMMPVSESEEENDGEGGIDEDGEDIDKLGFGDL